MRSQQAASSPSWRMVRSRSSSLPRLKIRPTTLAVGSGWGNSWLPAPESPQKSIQNSIWDMGSPSRRSLSPPRRRRPLRRTPVLTLTLIKLDEQLLQYCQYLKDPSFENVSSACALLDSTVATASPVSSERGSPASYVGSPPLGSSPGSPGTRSPRSPLRSWLTGNRDSPPTPAAGNSPVSTSALALEGEWEKIAVPFFILAGAEAVYADLGHVIEDGSVARNLIALYETITNALHLVRQTLCDPFLVSEEATLEQQQLQNQQSGSTFAMYTERASSVAMSLHALANITRARCELIQLHSGLWESCKGGVGFGDLGRSFHELLPNLPSDGARAQPMCDAVEREVKAWKYMMETAFALERCRFAETILSAQKTKSLLDISSNTCIQVWLRKTLRHMISIMPVFFDRIEAFSKPLYGFDQISIQETASKEESHRLGPTEDLEEYVLRFLQQQDKAGGPAIAVSVVLDAVSTSNVRVERGYTLTEIAPVVESAVGMNQQEAALSHWPAIYMRTTMHHGFSTLSSGGGILRGMRRTAGRKEARVGRVGSRSHEDDPASSMRQPNIILRSWSNDASPSIGKESSKRQHQAKQLSLNVLEYGPESGSTASSWPHAAWTRLVALLADRGDDQLPELPLKAPSLDRGSFGNMEVDLISSIRNWPGLSAATTTSNDSSAPPSPTSPVNRLARQDAQTSFFVSVLSDFLWLVVMVKGEEESLWHRRRSRTALEEEANVFLNTMASQLRVADWFSSRHVHQLRQRMFKSSLGNSSHGHFRREHGLVFEMRVERAWNDDDLQKLLKSIKEIFGLRARRPIIGPLYSMSSYGLSFVSKRGSPRNRVTATVPPRISLQKSAVALFLGTELMHAIGE